SIMAGDTLVMLPLASSASITDTGATDSWNDSTFCATPSSVTTRLSRSISTYWLDLLITVNSSEAFTGAGSGDRYPSRATTWYSGLAVSRRIARHAPSWR